MHHHAEKYEIKHFWNALLKLFGEVALSGDFEK